MQTYLDTYHISHQNNQPLQFFFVINSTCLLFCPLSQIPTILSYSETIGTMNINECKINECKISDLTMAPSFINFWKASQPADHQDIHVNNVEMTLRDPINSTNEVYF